MTSPVVNGLSHGGWSDRWRGGHRAILEACRRAQPETEPDSDFAVVRGSWKPTHHIRDATAQFVRDAPLSEHSYVDFRHVGSFA